ncbi:MAG TPA: ABC transporter permease, partial [Polyangiaceae bacterium]|nr:ABC transporter permease [Polyangiaceae bacterium]
MLLDIRFAIRLLFKNLGFTAVAIVTLGLAVAANTVVFSIVNAILVRPLPFAEPSRLIQINTTYPKQWDALWDFSAPEYVELAREAHAFDSIGAWERDDVNLTGGDRPMAVNAAYTTASFLPTFGVAPMLGRLFEPSEDVPGDPSAAISGYGGTRAVILGYDLFATVFGGDRNIVGRTVRVNAMPATVVGVMPRGFDFPEQTQIWMPIGLDMSKIKMTRGSHWLGVVGRLKRGVDLPAARAEMDLLMPAWAAEHTGEHTIEPGLHPIVLAPLQGELVGSVRLALLTLQTAVVFVLLIACANISNLLLARAEARSGEIAVRAALGASLRRMARQFLVESMVLGVAGAGVGTLLAMWGLDTVLALLPEGVPRAHEIRLDPTTLAYGVAVALGTSLVFGLTPILHARADLASTLRAAGQRTATSNSGKRLFRRALILAQVALAIVLVTGAGLMIRSFVRLQKTDLGFDPRGMVTLELQLPKKAYPTDADVYAFWTRLREGAASLPGVTSATLARGLPPMRPMNANSFEIIGRVKPERTTEWSVDYWQTATDDYFSTLGIPLLRGRLFDASDREDSPKVIVINESMAKKYWPNEDPIGRRVRLTSFVPP